MGDLIANADAEVFHIFLHKFCWRRVSCRSSTSNKMCKLSIHTEIWNKESCKEILFAGHIYRFIIMISIFWNLVVIHE